MSLKCAICSIKLTDWHDYNSHEKTAHKGGIMTTSGVSKPDPKTVELVEQRLQNFIIGGTISVKSNPDMFQIVDSTTSEEFVIPETEVGRVVISITDKGHSFVIQRLVESQAETEEQKQEREKQEKIKELQQMLAELTNSNGKH